MIEAAVRSLILAAVDPSPLVYVGIAPKGTPAPYTVIYPVSEDPRYTHDGRSALRRVTIQTSCFANSYTEVKALADLILSALDILGPVSAAGTDIDLGVIDSSHYAYEDDTALHHVACRFTFHYSETH